MELLEVLNEDGETTGKVLDKNEIHKYGKYHKEVALMLLNDKGEILLQKRASTKEIEPDKWAWHGGHVIVGETCIEAIIREVKEEIGITLTEKQIKPLVKLKSDKFPNRHYTIAYYSICNLNIDDFSIQKEELSQVKWFSFKKFKDMIYNGHPDIMFKNNENTNKIICALENIIKFY